MKKETMITIDGLSNEKNYAFPELSIGSYYLLNSELVRVVLVETSSSYIVTLISVETGTQVLELTEFIERKAIEKMPESIDELTRLLDNELGLRLYLVEKIKLLIREDETE